MGLIKNTITFSLVKKARDLKGVPSEAFDVWVKNTPIKTGNARRRTTLVRNTMIDAHYDYAVPLDRGHSKQSPQGMQKPTEAFLKRRLGQIIRKK